MQKLVLYSRIECPLCEFAMDLLVEAGIGVHEVDIDDDEALIKQYHTTIPVLQYKGDLLKWPFSVNDVRQLME